MAYIANVSILHYLSDCSFQGRGLLGHGWLAENYAVVVEHHALLAHIGRMDIENGVQQPLIVARRVARQIRMSRMSDHFAV